MAKNKNKSSLKLSDEVIKKIPYSGFYAVSGGVGMMEQKIRVDKKDPLSRFSECFAISDINPQNVIGVNPDDIHKAMEALLNGFPENVEYQFVLQNTLTEKDTFIRSALLPVRSGFEEANDAYNSLVQDNATLGHNNTKRQKFIVFSVEGQRPEDVLPIFADIEAKARPLFYNVCSLAIAPLSCEAWMNLLYDIYNVGGGAFGMRANMPGREFSIQKMSKALTTKDVIGPKSIKEEKNYLLLNDQVYARAFFINNFPTIFTDALIGELTGVSSTMIYSAHYVPVDTNFGYDLARDAVVQNTRARRVHASDTVADRKDGKAIVKREMIHKTEEAYFDQDALDTLMDSKSSDAKTFMLSAVIVLFATDKETLEKDTKLLTLSATRFAFQIKCLDYNQIAGFNTALPYGKTFVDIKRVFPVSKLASLNPLDVQSSLKRGGLFYGLNAINDNIVLLNRKNSSLSSGLICGVRNAGKTFEVKRETLNTLLSSNDDVYIISSSHNFPKYQSFAGRLPRGSALCIEGGRLNLFKTIPDYGAEILKANEFKAELLASAFSSVLDFATSMSKESADAVYAQVLAECNALVAAGVDTADKFRQYTDAGNAPRCLEAFDKAGSPYLVKEGVDAPVFNNMASLHIFKADKPIDILLLLNEIWIRGIARKKQNVSSWIYIDDADSVIKAEGGSRYLRDLMMVSDILSNPVTLTLQKPATFVEGYENYAFNMLFSQMSYFKLLNQGPVERKMFADKLHIPSSLLSYITNSGVGKGIIISSSATTPFNDNLEEIGGKKLYDILK